MLLGVLVPLGLAWRFAQLGLPPFAFKYGTSVLWAAAVYWLLAAALPTLRTFALAGLAGLVAMCVELFKLVHSPGLDAFRETLPGQLLLGRHFTLGALAAYWIGIGAVALLDGYGQPGRGRRSAARQAREANKARSG